MWATTMRQPSWIDNEWLVLFPNKTRSIRASQYKSIFCYMFYIILNLPEWVTEIRCPYVFVKALFTIVQYLTPRLNAFLMPSLFALNHTGMFAESDWMWRSPTWKIIHQLPLPNTQENIMAFPHISYWLNQIILTILVILCIHY